MVEIKFKNLDRSDLVAEIVRTRFETLLESFPDLQEHSIRVTIDMQNSPHQAGPDEFHVKTQIHGFKFKNVIVDKNADNLYKALAEVVEVLHEKLNRSLDKKKAKMRQRVRRASNQTL